jgi:hypothetical protein
MSFIKVVNHRGKCVGAIAGGRYCQRVAGGWSQVSAIGGRADGVALASGADGEYITFAILGIVTVTSGAAVADGDQLMSDAQGRAITYAAAAGRCRTGFADHAVGAAAADLTTNHMPQSIAG